MVVYFYNLKTMCQIKTKMTAFYSIIYCYGCVPLSDRNDRNALSIIPIPPKARDRPERSFDVIDDTIVATKSHHFAHKYRL